MRGYCPPPPCHPYLHGKHHARRPMLRRGREMQLDSVGRVSAVKALEALCHSAYRAFARGT